MSITRRPGGAASLVVAIALVPALAACEGGTVARDVSTQCRTAGAFTKTVTCTMTIAQLTASGPEAVYSYDRYDEGFATSYRQDWPLTIDATVESGTLLVRWDPPDGGPVQGEVAPGKPLHLAGRIRKRIDNDRKRAFTVYLRPTVADPDGQRRARNLRVTMVYSST